jgi:glycosyltransferase involved in cell wall biosynthesis
MKITIITNLYPPHVLGGYELLCANVVDCFRSLGHEVFILTSSHGVDTPAQEPDISRTLSLYAPFDRAAKMERGRRKKTFRHNRAVAAKHLKSFRPDLVFVWSQLRLTTGAAVAAQELGIPVAFTMNDGHIESYVPKTVPTSFRSAVRCLLDATWDRRITLRSLDLTHTTCISGHLKQYLLAEGVPVPGAVVIHQGIPLEQFPRKSGTEPLLHSPVRLVYVGQLHEYKGVHFAISALHQLHQESPGGYHLTIIGSGPDDYMRQLRQQVQSLELGAVVEFEGKVERATLSRHYQRSDILLMTSLWDEPFGLTHLEAMASGTPVISTFRGGMKEFLVDNENCLTFDPDRPGHLSSQIKRLVETPALRDRLIENAYQMVTHQYSMERYVEDLLKFIKQIVNPL